MTSEEIIAELRAYISFEAKYGAEEATFDPETAQAIIDLLSSGHFVPTGNVKMPESRQEAAAMALIGELYLKDQPK